MLVVEGAAHVGKSTLCQKVSELTDYPVYHMKRPEKGFDFHTGYFQGGPLEIRDRFHLGALVYHEKGTMTPENLSVIEGTIRGWGGLIVVLYHSDDDEYRDILLNDTRMQKGKIGSVEDRVRHNQDFRMIANRRFKLQDQWTPVVDLAIDVRSGFVAEELAAWITKSWLTRVQSALTLSSKLLQRSARGKASMLVSSTGSETSTPKP